MNGNSIFVGEDRGYVTELNGTVLELIRTDVKAFAKCKF
jgi:hypothetical protein